jgi:hypothetical protein
MTPAANEFDFWGEPQPSRVENQEVLVPLHADNWALALGAGYVGGALKDDQAKDLQSHFGCNLAGFVGYVPSWAISEGEAGPRAVLRVRSANVNSEPGKLVIINGPLRVTEITAACFESQELVDNFQASYGLFPDIPASLVPTLVGGFEVREEARDVDLGEEVGACAERREDLDFLGGWAAGVLAILRAGGHDEAIGRFLEQISSAPDLIGEASLRAFDPTADDLDVAIWRTAVQGLRKRFRNRGFDRQEFLSEIRAAIEGLGQKGMAWADGCRKVINAEIDIPELDDNAKLGRRATLALILAHEPEAIANLSHSLGVGPKVAALVTQAVYAFTGLSRLDASNKCPANQLNGLLALAEAMESGNSVQLECRPGKVGADFSRTIHVSIAGNEVFERLVQPPPYLLMLKARALEAGYKVEVDQDLGKLLIQRRQGRNPAIIIEDESGPVPGQPVVNLVLPLAKLGARPTTASLKSYLEVAWHHATAIGLRSDKDGETVCALASLPLATLDQAELEFHVERLISVWEALGGKKSTGKRRKTKSQD